MIPKDKLLITGDKQVVWLANRVWRRLPPIERQFLFELGTRVTDVDETTFIHRYLLSPASTQKKQQETGIITESFPAQFVADIPQCL